MALVKAGANRQEMHERIRQCSMIAWQSLQRGEVNPLSELLASDQAILGYLSPDEVRAILAQGTGVGDAPERSRALARLIRQAIAAD
jgi:adenylosuccinate lyase